MKRFACAAIAALALTVPVFAEESCSPNDMATRILQSANPNDLHPDWAGENRIGTSFSLFVTSEIADGIDDAFTYVTGSLVDPRGNELGEIFAIKREWSCS